MHLSRTCPQCCRSLPRALGMCCAFVRTSFLSISSRGGVCVGDGPVVVHTPWPRERDAAPAAAAVAEGRMEDGPAGRHHRRRPRIGSSAAAVGESTAVRGLLRRTSQPDGVPHVRFVRPGAMNRRPRVLQPIASVESGAKAMHRQRSWANRRRIKTDTASVSRTASH